MSPATAAAPVLGVYCPDLGEVKAALVRALGEPEAHELWPDLLAHAGLIATKDAGLEAVPDDVESLQRVLEVMGQADRVLQMCRLSIWIRLQGYLQVSAMHTALQGIRT